jgi:hypothetical protein
VALLACVLFGECSEAGAARAGRSASHGRNAAPARSPPFGSDLRERR